MRPDARTRARREFLGDGISGEINASRNQGSQFVRAYNDLSFLSAGYAPRSRKIVSLNNRNNDYEYCAL